MKEGIMLGKHCINAAFFVRDYSSLQSIMELEYRQIDWFREERTEFEDTKVGESKMRNLRKDWLTEVELKNLHVVLPKSLSDHGQHMQVESRDSKEKQDLEGERTKQGFHLLPKKEKKQEF